MDGMQASTRPGARLRERQDPRVYIDLPGLRVQGPVNEHVRVDCRSQRSAQVKTAWDAKLDTETSGFIECDVALWYATFPGSWGSITHHDVG
jgi:hypothetical protein